MKSQITNSIPVEKTHRLENVTQVKQEMFVKHLIMPPSLGDLYEENEWKLQLEFF